MRRRFLPLLLLVSLPLAAWGLAAFTLPRIPPPPGGILVAWLALLVASASLVMLRWEARAFGRVAAMEGPTVRAGRGGFEWEPAGQPLPHALRAIHIRHEWLDVDRGRHVQARIVFELPDAAPQEELRRATARALKAATSALPARGRVSARGDWQDVPGPMARVKVLLDVRGHGADVAWARAAAEAFEEEFSARLEKKGWETRRR